MSWVMLGFVIWCVAVMLVILKPEVFIKKGRGR